MSKELNALECLEALEQDIKDRVILAEARQLNLCAIIKQALLELQYIKEASLIEALGCLECLYCESEDYRSNDRAKDYEYLKQALLKAEKEHKALEIIKKTKNIKVSFYENGSGKHYKIEFDRTRNQTITKEEFNLLKEVME